MTVTRSIVTSHVTCEPGEQSLRRRQLRIEAAWPGRRGRPAPASSHLDAKLKKEPFGLFFSELLHQLIPKWRIPNVLLVQSGGLLESLGRGTRARHDSMEPARIKP